MSFAANIDIHNLLEFGRVHQTTVALGLGIHWDKENSDLKTMLALIGMIIFFAMVSILDSMRWLAAQLTMCLRGKNVVLQWHANSEMYTKPWRSFFAI